MLYTFTPNKSYAYLLNVEPSNLVFLKTCNTEFDQVIIVLLNIINHQLPHIDKTHLYVQDSYESKYQLLTNAREKVVENQKRSNSFFDY